MRAKHSPYLPPSSLPPSFPPSLPYRRSDPHVGGLAAPMSTSQSICLRKLDPSVLPRSMLVRREGRKGGKEGGREEKEEGGEEEGRKVVVVVLLPAPAR